MKTCSRCKLSKPLDQFHRRTRSADGYNYHCVACEAAAQRQVAYRITQAVYDQLLADQDHKCAICGVTLTGRNRDTNVDHDHQTGQVRGILCRGCNVGLGNFTDDIGKLKAAIAYLSQVG